MSRPISWSVGQLYAALDSVRIISVVLFGCWAKGEAKEESEDKATGASNAFDQGDWSDVAREAQEVGELGGGWVRLRP